MTDCPPAENLLEFAAGKLSDDSQAFIEAHIDGCMMCRASLSSLAKGDDDIANKSFGRYQLETVLGQGGMGIVYRAYDPQLARPVAIKVVRHSGHESALRQRLVNEAQSLARLSHPNVCHVYDVGIDGDEVWVAMELIDGVTLRHWAQAHRTREELLAVLLGAAEGIAAAHASGLIHRDIKPENVLVTKDGRPIVMDFGLARIDLPVDPNASTMSGNPVLTATGAIVGTPAYLAPEQLTGDVLDARVDQFAWAAMAWELLTGVRPFPIIAAIRLDAIRVGLTPPPSLEKPIAAALVRAMALASRDRYPSMRELIDALSAKEPERVNRTPFLVAGAAVLAVAATVIAWQMLRDDKPKSVASIPSTPPPPDAAMQVVQPPADAAVKIEPEPVEVVEPPKPEKKKTIAKAEPKAAPPPQPVATGSGSQAVAPATTTQPAPLRPLKHPKFSVVRSYATLVAFCKVPIDPKKPDPKLGSAGIVDWGPVTKRERVIAMLVDRESYKELYEVRGQRGTYRFDADMGALGSLDVSVGQVLAICPDPMRTEKNDIYQLPPAWKGGLDYVQAAIPLAGAPLVDQMKSLAPLHVEETKLSVSADKGKLVMKPASHYLVRTKVESADGNRWLMRDWWLEVPSGIRGANLVGAGKRLWFVIEAPAFEATADKPKMVAKAVMVFEEIFPQ